MTMAMLTTDTKPEPLEVDAGLFCIHVLTRMALRSGPGRREHTHQLCPAVQQAVRSLNARLLQKKMTGSRRPMKRVEMILRTSQLSLNCVSLSIHHAHVST
jgi:hypothetical protein